MTLYGIPPAGWRRAMAPDNGRDHARAITDTACAWWLENRGGTGDLSVAAGTLAALALLAPRSPEGPDVGTILIPLGDAELVDTLRSVWNSLWQLRPDLVQAAAPLHRWLAPPGPADIRGLADYTRVLVREGLLEYVCDTERCVSDDLLGLLVQRMSPRGQRAARGQFFTPANACDAAAEVLLADGPPSGVFLEPCAGTGTMVRAAALTLRGRGVDPASVSWWLNDVDEFNAACCAVNAVLWRLGPSVWVSCGDALRDPARLELAVRQRAAYAIEQRRRQPVLYPTSLVPCLWSC